MCTFPPSACAGPRGGGHFEGEGVCTWTKAVRVAHRRETSSASAPALNLKAIPVYATFESVVRIKGSPSAPKFTGEPEMLGLAVDLWLNLPSICPPGAMVRSSSVLSRGNHYRSKGRNPW
jgi:hypothetical protein